MVGLRGASPSYSSVLGGEQYPVQCLLCRLSVYAMTPFGGNIFDHNGSVVVIISADEASRGEALEHAPLPCPRFPHQQLGLNL